MALYLLHVFLVWNTCKHLLNSDLAVLGSTVMLNASLTADPFKSRRQNVRT
jgi:hypothetical protein